MDDINKVQADMLMISVNVKEDMWMISIELNYGIVKTSWTDDGRNQDRDAYEWMNKCK